MKGKTPKETEITMSELVLPNDTNLLGNLMGGRLMYWMDIAGALVASRHSNKVVATVSMDHVSFTHPVRMGERLSIHAKMIYAGNTSMVIALEVYAENMKTNSKLLTNKGRMVFVALDENACPTPVPPLVLETEEEEKAYLKEKERREKRKKK